MCPKMDTFVRSGCYSLKKACTNGILAVNQTAYGGCSSSEGNGQKPTATPQYPRTKPVSIPKRRQNPRKVLESSQTCFRIIQTCYVGQADSWELLDDDNFSLYSNLGFFKRMDHETNSRYLEEHRMRRRQKSTELEWMDCSTEESDGVFVLEL